jgi:hypothetical protein
MDFGTGYGRASGASTRSSRNKPISSAASSANMSLARDRRRSPQTSTARASRARPATAGRTPRSVATARPSPRPEPYASPGNPSYKALGCPRKRRPAPTLRGLGISRGFGKADNPVPRETPIFGNTWSSRPLDVSEAKGGFWGRQSTVVGNSLIFCLFLGQP